MKAWRGGESEARRGERRWAERRIASNPRKKGSVELAEERSEGRRWNCTWETWGKAEKKREMNWDSASETVGWAVMRVTRQWWWTSCTASLRKGVKWPMPALGRRATWGGWGCRASEIDIVRGAQDGVGNGEALDARSQNGTRSQERRVCLICSHRPLNSWSTQLGKVPKIHVSCTYIHIAGSWIW